MITNNKKFITLNELAAHLNSKNRRNDFFTEFRSLPAHGLTPAPNTIRQPENRSRKEFITSPATRRQNTCCRWKAAN